MNKYNICFVVVYYGKFPPWFPFFLKSCGENKNIDWMFVTDIEYNETIPNNVKFLKMTIDEYKKLISEKLEIEVECNFRKLCDHRPLQGFLFEDYLKEYDYWGWCDIDLIFGDLTEYVDKCSEGYECISFADFPCAFPFGPCTLIKNTIKMNNLFRKISNWKHILQLEHYCGIDEDWAPFMGQSIGHIMRDEKINYIKLDAFEDDSRVKYRKKRTRRIGTKKSWHFIWSNGKLIFNEKEYAFFHFFRTKDKINNLSVDYDALVNKHSKIMFGTKGINGIV